MKKRLLTLLLTMLLGLVQIEPHNNVYVPEEFTFTGGTGRVTITCPEIIIDDDEVLAKIVFSSQNYVNVKIDNENYTPEYTEDGAVFTIPVILNRTFSVFATTTAMSQPHEIEYLLYIGYGSDSPAGLHQTGSMDLKYAEGFSVDYYQDGYALINVGDSESYLVVPQGKEPPAELSPSIIILQKPLDHIYLAATSAMVLFDSIEALNHIRLSGTQQNDWYVENAIKAMENGDIIYAGKYSKPDFELLIRENCDLAVESMMILHTPQVRELIELLGIPVFIDRSSNEPHPLGRLEWIRLYGLLTDCESEAEAVFAQQAALVESVETPDSGKTVAFFSLKPNGTVTVRGSEDYIVRSIELAGGHYVFDTIKGQETNASVEIPMETFYTNAMNADYLIYNASIETPVESRTELISRQPLLADFKAFETGNVFCTERYLYQATNGIGTFIEDLRAMLAGDTDGMTFIYMLK